MIFFSIVFVIFWGDLLEIVLLRIVKLFFNFLWIDLFGYVIVRCILVFLVFVMGCFGFWNLICFCGVEVNNLLVKFVIFLKVFCSKLFGVRKVWFGNVDIGVIGLIVLKVKVGGIEGFVKGKVLILVFGVDVMDCCLYLYFWILSFFLFLVFVLIF